MRPILPATGGKKRIHRKFPKDFLTGNKKCAVCIYESNFQFLVLKSYKVNKNMSPILLCIHGHSSQTEIEDAFFERIRSIPDGYKHLNVNFAKLDAHVFAPSVLKAIYDFYSGIDVSIISKNITTWGQNELKLFL